VEREVCWGYFFGEFGCNRKTDWLTCDRINNILLKIYHELQCMMYGWCRVLGLDEIMRKESKEAMQVNERGEEFI
jgi:hypothetical protein